MDEMDEDEVSAESQLNQNPRPPSRIVFSHQLLASHTVPYQVLPLTGAVVNVWDLAFSTKDGRDFSTCAVGIFNEKNQLFIVDIIHDRFTPDNLAKKIVDVAIKTNPYIIGIESASGSKFLAPAIEAESLKRGAVGMRIDWFPVNNEKGAKKTRMSALHPLLMNDQLFFANYLTCLPSLYEEFEQCLGKGGHDDIPDVISQIPRYAPHIEQMFLQPPPEKWDSAAILAWRNKQFSAMMFENADCYGRIGAGGPMPVEVVNDPEFEQGMPSESPYPGEPSILGAGLFG
jgi:predicted phage terminase large subunit-like protein